MLIISIENDASLALLKKTNFHKYPSFNGKLVLR